MNSLLNVDQLTKQYSNQCVVDSISFQLEPNTSTALIGPNGAGKTTTLSMLAGLVKQTSGVIKFKDTAQGDVRTCVGFLPQYPKFFPWMTALEFVEMAARLSGMDKRKAQVESERTLAFVGLGEVMKKKVGGFSGGMKQRLGLAQAVVHKPKLLLLDEPVSALDPVGRRQIMDLLKELQKNTTILYSTHILNDAEEMTDQLIFMKAGKIVEQGSLGKVRKKYEEPKILIEFAQEEELNRFRSKVAWNIKTIKNTGIIEAKEAPITMNEVICKLSEGSFDILKLEWQTADLEDIFLKVVEGK
ncbi:ABC transporter ATP-binding protein [Aciduricibacillus chroicocephali]|uniref:ABC transporter ATP-binding protein n=1 Tax=Aciduricibacillus chroicocephali TaxID=3054939 RepID=A0ABY9KVW2_9BACI|nr:ABC transporter ATP-binding protein [Bacillaceae bacterium 44XB]